MSSVSDLARSCFFCAQMIEGKKDRSREHIVPEFLLERMNIKRETITGGATREYAKIKVPSHASCNNGFGSAFENKVKALLDHLDGLFAALVADESSIQNDYGPDSSARSVVATWLCKLYYGLFYHDLSKTTDEAWRSACAEIVASRNFTLIRDAYRQGHGFCLPSSLYAFRSQCAQAFDLRTSVSPPAILLKVDSLVLVMAIGDGFLARHYLQGEPLACLRANMELHERNSRTSPGYLLAWAEVLALLACIPKSPKCVESCDRIVNMSFMSLAANPGELYRLDVAHLAKVREHVLTELNLINPR